MAFLGMVESKTIGLLKTGVLYDFETGSATLLFLHRQWLETDIVPILKKGGSILIIGSASRIGTRAKNQQLSNQRVEAVKLYLKKYLNESNVLVMSYGFGERLAKISGKNPRSNDAYYRAVRVTAHLDATPPKPKIEPNPPHYFPQIIHREWHEASVREPNFGGDYLDKRGDRYTKLGDRVAAEWVDDINESGKPQLGRVAYGFVVTKVHIKEIEDKAFRGKSVHTIYDWTYGMPTEFVEVIHTRCQGTYDNHREVGSKTKKVKRSELQKLKPKSLIIYPDQRLRPTILDIIFK